MDIDGKERISRFLLNPRHVRADGTVKSAAFKPPKGKPLSVFLTSTINEADIWWIGDEIVAKPGNRTLCGRADFCAQHVFDLGHNIELETSTHHLHADIALKNWRDDIALFAADLASKSKYIKKV